MAVRERREVYTDAVIDMADMTLTECRPDDTRVFSIWDILRSWDGVPDIEIEIRRREPLPGNGR